MIRTRKRLAESGATTAVQIDSKTQARLWADVYDRALAERRVSAPREPLDAVKRRARRRRRRRG